MSDNKGKKTRSDYTWREKKKKEIEKEMDHVPSLTVSCLISGHNNNGPQRRRVILVEMRRHYDECRQGIERYIPVAGGVRRRCDVAHMLLVEGQGEWGRLPIIHCQPICQSGKDD